MLTNEVRNFTDDDIRAAVTLLELNSFDVEAALRMLEAHWEDTFDSSHPAYDVACRLDFDRGAANELIIVTDRFRELLGCRLSVSRASPGGA